MSITHILLWSCRKIHEKLDSLNPTFETELKELLFLPIYSHFLAIVTLYSKDGIYDHSVQIDRNICHYNFKATVFPNVGFIIVIFVAV